VSLDAVCLGLDEFFVRFSVGRFYHDLHGAVSKVTRPKPAKAVFWPFVSEQPVLNRLLVKIGSLPATGHAMLWIYFVSPWAVPIWRFTLRAGLRMLYAFTRNPLMATA
jgi:hypothetical protein